MPNFVQNGTQFQKCQSFEENYKTKKSTLHVQSTHIQKHIDAAMPDHAGLWPALATLLIYNSFFINILIIILIY